MKMKEINPHETETYRYSVDDRCLVVSSGSKATAPKIWLSESMCRWISENYKDTLSVKDNTEGDS